VTLVVICVLKMIKTVQIVQNLRLKIVTIIVYLKKDTSVNIVKSLTKRCLNYQNQVYHVMYFVKTAKNPLINAHHVRKV